MKITHNVVLNFHPIFIPLNLLFGAILDFGLRPGGAIGAYAPEGLRIYRIALLCHFLLKRPAVVVSSDAYNRK